MNTRGERNLGKKTKWDNLVGGTLYHSDGHHSKWRRYGEIVSKYLSIPTAVQEFWKKCMWNTECPILLKFKITYITFWVVLCLTIFHLNI